MEAFFLAEIFEKVNFDPYNFLITRLSARIFEPMKNFNRQKYAYIYRLNTIIRLTMLHIRLNGFELYSRLVPLQTASTLSLVIETPIQYKEEMP